MDNNVLILVAVIAVVIVVAAAVYFYLQRKPKGEESLPIAPMMKKEGGAAPAEGGRIEPTVGPVKSAEKKKEEEPGPEKAADPPLRAAPEASASEPSDRPDVNPLIEAVITIKGKTQFSANQAALAVKAFEQDFGTRVHTRVRNQITLKWEDVRRGGTYTDLVAALQLASRGVTVDQEAAEKFLAAVGHATATLRGESDVMDVPGILERAKVLRGLIDKYGIRMTIAVKGKVPFTEESAANYARMNGFGAPEPGLAGVMRDAPGEAPWLTIRLSAFDPKMILLELTPALCLPSRMPLATAFGAANDIAARTGGEITDSRGTALSSGAMVAITREIKEFYEAMPRDGIEPGSSDAKKVFA